MLGVINWQCGLRLSLSGEGSVAAAAESCGRLPAAQFALMEFERAVTCSRNCIVIGSRLDADIHANACRLAFHGHLLEPLSDPSYSTTLLPTLRVIKVRPFVWGLSGFPERIWVFFGFSYLFLLVLRKGEGHLDS